MIDWFRRAVGNGKVATLLIFVFIAILCLLLWRPAHADPEIDLRAGSSFGPGGAGPVLGLEVYEPIGPRLDLDAGTLLWGATPKASNNWDWHAGLRGCRWHLCAEIGASYLQRVDAVNGAHTNFYLGLSVPLGWRRLADVGMAHLSDAGTTPVNLGRDAALLGLRLQ